MLVLSLDFETTGLDKVNDRITEVGMILYSTKINRAIENSSYLVDAGLPVPQIVTDLTGISTGLIKKMGRSEKDAIEDVAILIGQADAVIGQNVIQFDKQFLDNASKRLGITIPEKPWIDTRTDLPLSVETKSLIYMAADHGFLNPFPHNAIADGLTVLKLAAMYDFDKMLARSKEPNVVLQSLQSFADNDKAKKLKFGFKPNLGKKWFRVVKASDVDILVKAAEEIGINLSIEKEITPEQVWYS
jgi:DNA polymerase III subunit epsilon